MTTPKTNYPRKTTESAIRKNILLSHVERKWSRMSNYFVRISIVLCVLAICCCLSLIMGCVDLYHAILGKIGLSLGGRALSVFLIKMGSSGGLALAIAVLFRAFLTAEAAPDLFNQMASSGAENSVSSWRQNKRNSCLKNRRGVRPRTIHLILVDGCPSIFGNGNGGHGHLRKSRSSTACASR